MVPEVSAGRDSFVAGRDQYLVIGQSSLTAWASPVDDGLYNRERPVFVQYLNPEIRACYGRGYRPQQADADLSHALHATRLAVLCTEGPLVIPASYLFEVPIMARFLESVEALRRAGCIEYSSYMPEAGAYAGHKAREYRGDARNPYSRHARGTVLDGLAWRPRLQSSAGDIAEDWGSAVTGPVAPPRGCAPLPVDGHPSLGMPRTPSARSRSGSTGGRSLGGSCEPRSR
jgi:hypothetical protein